MRNSFEIVELARRVAEAERACDMSITRYPATGANDTEEGRADWKAATTERDAAIKALIAAVESPSYVPCSTCKGQGRVPADPSGGDPR